MGEDSVFNMDFLFEDGIGYYNEMNYNEMNYNEMNYNETKNKCNCKIHIRRPYSRFKCFKFEKQCNNTSNHDTLHNIFLFAIYKFHELKFAKISNLYAAYKCSEYYIKITDEFNFDEYYELTNSPIELTIFINGEIPMQCHIKRQTIKEKMRRDKRELLILSKINKTKENILNYNSSICSSILFSGVKDWWYS